MLLDKAKANYELWFLEEAGTVFIFRLPSCQVKNVGHE